MLWKAQTYMILTLEECETYDLGDWVLIREKTKQGQYVIFQLKTRRPHTRPRLMDIL